MCGKLSKIFSFDYRLNYCFDIVIEKQVFNDSIQDFLFTNLKSNQI